MIGFAWISGYTLYSGVVTLVFGSLNWVWLKWEWIDDLDRIGCDDWLDAAEYLLVGTRIYEWLRGIE